MCCGTKKTPAAPVDPPSSGGAPAPPPATVTEQPGTTTTLRSRDSPAGNKHMTMQHYLAQLADPTVDIPMTNRDEYSEDVSNEGLDPNDWYAARQSTASRSGAGSEVSSTMLVASEALSLSETDVSNQAHNKYALSTETSAYANELAGIFSDKEFGNVDDPENLQHTVMRDYCRSSLEDLRALPNPFPNRFPMQYIID